MPILPDPADSPQTKTCTKCGEPKPTTDYYVKDKATGRLYSRCKACHSRMTADTLNRKYAENPEPFKATAKASYDANPEKRRAYTRAYYHANREIVLAKEKQKRQTPEAKAKKAAYRAANAERRNAYNKAYRKKNAAKRKAYNTEYRKKHPTWASSQVRKWQKKNADRFRVIRARARHRRRAILSGSSGTYTDAEWEAVKKAQDYRCLICGMHDRLIKLTVDHVIPISKGGPNIASNLAALCGPCNSHKKDRILDLRPKPKSRKQA